MKIFQPHRSVLEIPPVRSAREEFLDFAKTYSNDFAPKRGPMKTTGVCLRAVAVIAISGLFSSVFSQDSRFPSREYIRFGGRVVAIENAAAPALSTATVSFSNAAGTQSLKLTSGQPLAWTMEHAG